MIDRRLFLLLLLPLLAACQSATIESDHEAGYDFGPLRTYQWVDPETVGLEGRSAYHRQVTKGLAKVVAEEFLKRGYVREEEEPDFLATVAVTTRRASRVGGSSRGSRSRVSSGSLKVDEGAIVIRAWETGSKQLIWECWARDAIRESEPPTEESVTKLVRDMMKRFPAEVPLPEEEKADREKPESEKP